MADPPFIVAEGPHLSDSGPSLPQHNLVFLVNSVGNRAIFRLDTISPYQYQSPKSGHGSDISIYRILRYRMIWDTILWSIAIYQAISHRITPNHQAKTISTRTHHLVAVYLFSSLSLPSSWLVSRLAFGVVILLSMSWRHHKTDGITSKHQTCPITTRPATWSHVMFLFHFFIFLLATWYSF